MDPDANLKEQLSLASLILSELDRGGDYSAGPSLFDVARLAELVQSMDQWIARGGSLPLSWEAARP